MLGFKEDQGETKVALQSSQAGSLIRRFKSIVKMNEVVRKIGKLD